MCDGCQGILEVDDEVVAAQRMQLVRTQQGDQIVPSTKVFFHPEHDQSDRLGLRRIGRGRLGDLLHRR